MIVVFQNVKYYAVKKIYIIAKNFASQRTLLMV